jgi:hypothetical protein
MPSNRRPLRFFALLLVFAGCAPIAVGRGTPSSSSGPNPVASSRAGASASVAAETGKRGRSPVLAKAPPPVVTTPLPGEPLGAKLAESRLSASSCTDYKARRKSLADDQVAQMRSSLAESYREWHEAQPECWAEDRRRDAERRLMESGSGFGGGLGSIGGSGFGSAAGGIGSGRPGGVAEARAASSYSRTNTQVASVDEADMVKTDGRYVYFAINGALRIAEALNPRIVSVTKLTGNVRELFVEGDRAVVYTSIGRPGQSCTYGYDCVFAGDGTATRITVFDVKDRTAPKVVREIDLTGSLMTARRIGHAVHTVVADGDPRAPSFESWPADLEMCGTPEKVVRAKFDKLRLENEQKIRQTFALPTVKERGVEKQLCDSLLRPRFDSGTAFTSVVSFDLTRDTEPVTTSSVESRPGAVFASSDTLYMAVTRSTTRTAYGRGVTRSRSSNQEVESSDIHAFHIGQNPSDTKYEGSGVVPGHVLDSFAMDEWYGYLRVATSKGRVPDPKVESVLSVFAKTPDGNRVRVGAVDHIAPGEDIRSVRFDDDRGYVVTFKKTDPLFVMDLAAPDKPKILGELKIPGFSTYMHRIDPDHLLSIGFDAVDHGSFAYFDGVILQLFDVKNPTDPKLLHKEKLGSRGSSSEAATNHLAFNYFAEKGLLAVPMTVCEGGGDGVAGQNLAFSGLYVYDVDLERGFTRLGGIDHGTRGVSCSTWWSNANSSVKRSVFLDDLVYSMATDRVKVQKLGHFGTDVASLSLLP